MRAFPPPVQPVSILGRFFAFGFCPKDIGAPPPTGFLSSFCVLTSLLLEVELPPLFFVQLFAARLLGRSVVMDRFLFPPRDFFFFFFSRFLRPPPLDRLGGGVLMLSGPFLPFPPGWEKQALPHALFLAGLIRTGIFLFSLCFSFPLSDKGDICKRTPCFHPPLLTVDPLSPLAFFFSLRR